MIPEPTADDLARIKNQQEIADVGARLSEREPYGLDCFHPAIRDITGLLAECCFLRADVQTAEARAVAAERERDEARTIIANANSDLADEDTAIRDLCRPHLAALDVDGDSSRSKSGDSMSAS